jgi:UDP-N-acetylglucosamine 1-carboxyvinyltransferase
MSKFVIEGGRQLGGSVKPSGNKNEALPALMACLLTDQPITFKRIPKIGDVVTMCDVLHSLGVEVHWHDDQTLTLHAKKVSHHNPDPKLCAKVRASILLLGPLLARLGKVELPLPGGDVIGARRIDTHFEGMVALGAKLELEGAAISGTLKRAVGTSIYMDEPSVTATENLLLLAATCEGKTILHNAACEPHVVGLCRLLSAMGAKIYGIGTNRLDIIGVPSLTGADHTISADFMEVGSFICLGAAAKAKITIEDINHDDYRFILKTFGKIGIETHYDNGNFIVDGTKPMKMKNDITGRVATIYSGPWPAFPTDLMSVTIVAATQSEGTVIFFEKMFEGRMFFTDKLMAMGATIILCDPHRIVVNGPAQLYASKMSSPDVRAGMSLLIASLLAKGTSEIDNIVQIERGYYQVEKKLQALGAVIKRI